MTENGTMEARQRAALERMKQVRHHYERLQTECEAIAGSGGQVTAWGRVGSSGNRVSRPTQNRAMRAVAMEEERRAMLDWFECLRGTYYRLKGREGKSPNLWRHQLILARALRLYAFEGADGELMALALGAPKKLSRRKVVSLLREAALEVAADAEKAGLFRAEEEARTAD